ncbi:hypothetical protein [Vibrio porteresiae]|uniref:Uncharacterized protein n=1 Tax=Vibrio porteresiae DSM 19223 TaxID=1123496 RepID=A0ABZ0QC87_9VIBR|nr:hypothetical protein [Vibrio porteresiae]WPC73387.1 hypothetical protein R8Z52_14895 [Vibrio porteresiae DSM 19223]
MQSPFFWLKDSLRAKRYFSSQLAMNIEIEKSWEHPSFCFHHYHRV